MKKLTRNTLHIFVLFISFLILFSIGAKAQWTTNTAVNTPIIFPPAISNGAVPSLVSDANGGAFIAWSGSADISVQRVDAQGYTKWAQNGIVICNQSSSDILAVSDGVGGLVITWVDNRDGNYDIYAQRIDSTGNILWTPNGVAISTDVFEQNHPKIVSDNTGGAVISWTDQRKGNSDIYARRINAYGVAQWTTSGVPICIEASEQPYYRTDMVSDGTGGAIITWSDNRNGEFQFDIFAQRIDSAGVIRWFELGNDICTSPGSYMQRNPKIISDGLGGAIIIWNDERSDGTYAQRINALGDISWTIDGKLICTNTTSPSSAIATSDDSGGVIIIWLDARNPSMFDVFAQRFDSSGEVKWTPNGILISTGPVNINAGLVIASDGFGGAIINWVRNGIEAQRIDKDGNLLWPVNGVVVSTQPDAGSPSIISDGSGGAIIACSSMFGDFVAVQNICANGFVGIAPPSPPISMTITANLTICSGKSTSLSAAGIGSIGWYSATKGGTYLGGGPDFTTGKLTFTTPFYVQDSTCTANAKRTLITVIVNALPTLNVTSFPASGMICLGDSMMLNVEGALNYTFSGGITKGNNFAPSSTTTYTIVGTDINNCSDTARSSITVNSLPTISTTSIPASGIICAGDSVMLNGFGASVYSITGGITNGNKFVLFSTTTYTVIGTDGNNCSDTITAIINVNALPTLQINSTPSSGIICAGDTVKLSGTGASTFVFTDGINTGNSFAPATTTTYTITGTDVNNCSGSVFTTITVNSLPTISAISIPASGIICVGDSIRLNGTGASAYIFTGGVTNGNDFVLSSTKTFTITGTDINNCADTNEITITVNDLPTVSVTSMPASGIICASDSVRLYGAGAFSYTITGGVNNGNGFILHTTTTYTLTGTDTNNCSSSASITITVNPLPTLSTEKNILVCIGDTVMLNASGSGGDYTWLPDIWFISNTGSTVNAIFPAVSGNYTFSVSLADIKNCKVTDTIHASVEAVFTANAGQDTSICAGTGINLIGSGGSTYAWLPETGLSATNTDTTAFNPTMPGIYSYSLTVSSGIGCVSAPDEIIISVLALPTVDAGADITIMSSESDTLRASGNALSYTWSPVLCTDCLNPFVAPTATTQYMLMADNGTCKAYDSVTVSVIPYLCEIFVPNAFSPNGDSQNDFISVSGDCILPGDFDFRIYDRWGAKI